MIDCQQIELLSPARDKRIAIEAITHGADAVYMGASHHGARALAANSVADVADVVDYAHRFGARVYVTVNTLVYDSEIADVERLIADLYRIGVDALIVQDMGILRMNIPPIARHASTQCDIRTVEKARFLEAVGFSQLVLPREFSLEEIKAVHDAVKVPLEVFVHGALCVSYSGDCQASCLTNGRSANRGECAQMCRLPYDLIDEKGNVIARSKHFLSLRDLNRSESISALIDAGARSFKIEGRLKDIDYVKNVTAHYRRAIDKVIEASGGMYCRSSYGTSECSFTPQLDKSFNRGFTTYFTFGTERATKMASLATPKFVGEKIGKVIECKGNRITISAECRLNNGDGLGYFDAEGPLAGFRVNRVEGNVVFAAENVAIPKATVLYRNNDKEWNDLMQSSSAVRKIHVTATLRRVGDDRVCLSLADNDGHSISHCVAVEPIVAKTPQEDARRRVLTKTGDTVYSVDEVDDRCSDLFIPASVLSTIRRDAFALLDSQIRITHPIQLRRTEDSDTKHVAPELTYHDNVANHLAEEFYRSHGVEKIAPAAEVVPPKGDAVVMTTRYCLRRELGCCRKEASGDRLPQKLYLRHGTTTFELEFDCRNCQMRVKTHKG